MSSILKALKKLEEEKSARRNGSVDITKGILRSIPRHTGKARWVLPVSVAGAAFAAALLTYFLMGGPSSRNREAAPEASLRPASEAYGGNGQIHASAPNATSKTLHMEDEPEITAVSKPVLKKKETIPVTTAPSGIRPLSRSPKISDKTKVSPQEQLPEQNTRELPKHTVESVQRSDEHPLPMLKVSGIAWHKDGTDRLAVVNGMSVAEGMTVDGARVDVIFQDKVRFTFEKRTFDVAVGNEMW